MRKKRLLMDGVFYHVTSRTNNRINAFESESGKLTMLLTLEDAKEKFHFQLANFCIMPNHIHLLLKPDKKTNLSKIMHWINLRSAKRYNFARNLSGHLWGDRYFSRIIKDKNDFERVMNYIYQNPVEAGLCESPVEWRTSGAYYYTLCDKIDF